MRTKTLCAFALLILLLAGWLFGGSPGAAFQDATPASSVTPTLAPTATPSPSPTITPLPTASPTPPVPTLIPPTPLPTAAQDQVTLADFSGLARARDAQVLRVGALYNAYPFVWLNEFGEVAGYEADVMRAVGIELGIQIEFVQVTRHHAHEFLLSGEVDLLIGQQVAARDVDSVLEFAHPYYVNQERMVVRQDSPWTDLTQMAGQPVSVVLGTRSERALAHWSQQTGVSFDLRPALTENEALDALAAGAVEGMVGTLDSLSRAGRQQMRLIDQPVLNEYYAIAVRPHDVNLLKLLNRSLQRLKASGRLDQIYQQWFPGTPIDFTALVPVYENLYKDTRGFGDFPTDLPVPTNPVQARIAAGQPLRVAGLIGPGEQDVPAQVRLTDALNRALVEEMARRWGVPLEIVPNSTRNAVDLVAGGQADLAVGVSPTWDQADRVEYSLGYIQHADQLLVRQNEMWPRITTGFSDMLGTGWSIGYFADEPQDKENIQYYADYFRVGENITILEIMNENRAIYTMVVDKNLKAIFGDSLRLMALMRDSDYNTEDYIKLLPTPYGDIHSIALAVPRGDTGFRALVDSTLQDLAADGTYRQLWEAHFGLGAPLSIPTWPAVSPDSP